MIHTHTCINSSILRSYIVCGVAFFLGCIAFGRPSFAETLVLNQALESISGDAGGLSSCGLTVGEPAKLTVVYRSDVEANFADDTSATFFGAIESYNFELGNLQITGTETDFNENAINLTDVIGDEGIQIANLRATSLNSGAEMDVTAFHELPDDLIETPSDLSQLQNFVENSNQLFSVELWFECRTAGSEGDTLVTFTAFSVPEPLSTSSTALGILILFASRCLRRRRSDSIDV